MARFRMGRKIKWRKSRTLKPPAKPWTGRHKTNRREANRRLRHQAIEED